MATTVIGVFESADQAETIVRKLKRNGILAHQIQVFLREFPSMRRDPDSWLRRGVEQGACWGAIVGLLAALVSLSFPTTTGPLFGSEPAWSMLACLAIGAMVGAVIGGMATVPLPEIESGHPIDETLGKVVVSVTADARKADRAASIMRAITA